MLVLRLSFTHSGMWALECVAVPTCYENQRRVAHRRPICSAAPLLWLQLRRRAGIPTTPADDETYGAFTNAVAEHEAQLRVQYAGGCWAWGAGGRCGKWASATHVAPSQLRTRPDTARNTPAVPLPGQSMESLAGTS